MEPVSPSEFADEFWWLACLDKAIDLYKSATLEKEKPVKIHEMGVVVEIAQTFYDGLRLRNL